MLKKLLNKNKLVASKKVVQKAISDKNLPFLISFPRTGSHWLRLLMELYFEKPSIVRSFVYPIKNGFTCYHTHDLNLDIKRDNVIYLYRNPVEVIYSQMRYNKEDINNKKNIDNWSKIYAEHLCKWLIKEGFTKKKVLISYEGMCSKLQDEFKKICSFFSTDFNEEKFNKVSKLVDKDYVKKMTKHDEQVINRGDDYYRKRLEFIEKYTDSIMHKVYSEDEKLSNFVF